MKTIHIPLKMSLEGGKVPIQVDRWTLDLYTKTSYFESVTVYVDIFEGIDDNEMIVLKGQGNYGGDLKVFVKIDNTTDFTRSGLDLIFTKQITLKESLCGFQFDLMLLNDKVLTIKNKRGNVISPHFEKRIPNMGIKREQRVGSLIIKFDILFPSYLAANAIDTIEKLF